MKTLHPVDTAPIRCRLGKIGNSQAYRNKTLPPPFHRRHHLVPITVRAADQHSTGCRGRYRVTFCQLEVSECAWGDIPHRTIEEETGQDMMSRSSNATRAVKATYLRPIFPRTFHVKHDWFISHNQISQQVSNLEFLARCGGNLYWLETIGLGNKMR